MSRKRKRKYLYTKRKQLRLEFDNKKHEIDNYIDMNHNDGSSCKLSHFRFDEISMSESECNDVVKWIRQYW